MTFILHMAVLMSLSGGYPAEAWSKLINRASFNELWRIHAIIGDT